MYRTLEKLTDNTGNPPKSRYRALMRMLLQWRHLKLLKRGGRGHDPSGVIGTSNGQLAIWCPSCPWPTINLPDTWAQAPPELQFLYTVLYCVDANFRLKNQLVSSFSTDPGLGIGMTFMVPRRPFDQYVLNHTNDNDISTCVGFSALAKANTKFSKGLRYTGVAAVSCGRSEMLIPNGAVNLHKGERYSHMDYAVASSLLLVGVSLVIISYDISCQWFINLSRRIKDDWPDHLKPKSTIQIRPLVPKLHEPSHERAGHDQYSFNLSPGVGLSDGECPERIWSAHNALGNGTKTQGPGSRHDVLDNHFNFWNWLKYNTMGRTLMRRYKAAVSDRNIQMEAHRGFTLTLPEPLVKKWEEICIAWEKAPHPKRNVVNPYETPELYLSEAQIRKELADDDEARLTNGGQALHETSPSAFLVLGLELEETQSHLKRNAKATTTSSTLNRGTSLTQQRNALRTRLRHWQRLQALYMPGLARYLQELDVSSPHTNTSSNLEDWDLNLSSSFPAAQRQRICTPHLAEMEEKLRTAQCHDALQGIRHILRVKSRMVLFKNKNIRGQHPATRSRAVIDRVHERARMQAEKYHGARKAKLALSGPGDWDKVLLPLQDSDIRCYTDPERLKGGPGRKGTREDEELDSEPSVPSIVEDEGTGIDLLPEERQTRDGTGQTRKTISWIWRTARKPDQNYDPEKDDILRAEWARSRARAGWASEEVMLLREEMRRVLHYLAWKADWWLGYQFQRTDGDKALAEGVRAYAIEQAKVQRRLLDRFRKIWEAPLTKEKADFPAQQNTNAKGDNVKGNKEDDDNQEDDGGSEDGEDEDDDKDDNDENETMEDDGEDESDEE